ncbi:MAG: HD domain-containing protein, partial [Anaerolineae bacterium]
MTDARFRLLDLFDLPNLEKEIVVWLLRNGPADPDALVQALGRDRGVVQEALAALASQKRVRFLANSQVGAVMGRARGRTTLPARLWNAVLATERPYSRQEIATLRTVVPILQFARARLTEFADHGPGHALRVRSFAGQLGFVLGLSPSEQQLLRTGALFHDVGNVVDRARHNEISRQTVLRLCAEGQLPFCEREAEIVGLLCQWHRGAYDPHRRDELDGEIVRTGLLASILRVADAMDIDHRRSDYSQRLSWVLRLFYPQELPYWTSLEEILGVRIHCAPEVWLQVLTEGQVQANMQIAMLRGDLDSTPLDWSIQELAVEAAPLPERRSGGKEHRPALLVFPFEPHSLIMAALSRKHLVAAGYEVELLCYPDTAGGPRWLWGQVLPEIDPGRYDRLVVVGDRPDRSITPQLLRTVEGWQRADAAVSLLNRHEANWQRLPSLLRSGVEVILGGDWAYFWGDAVSLADLVWARIAALCSRDP